MAKKFTDAEFEKLINDNLRLVVSVANRYAFNGFSPTYLTEIGKVGIYQAALNFDANRGTKFSTFAYPYIIGAIMNDIRSNSDIHPKYGLVKRIRSELEKSRGQDYTTEDIANASNGELTIEEIEEVYLYSRGPLSYETAKNDDELSLEEQLSSSDNDPAVVFSQHNEQERANQLVDSYCQHLNNDEYMVFSYKIGLNGLQQLNDVEIAKTMGLSVSRVKTLYNHALHKLRSIIKKH